MVLILCFTCETRRILAFHRAAADGSSKEIDLKNKSPEEVNVVFASLRNSATGVSRSLSKPVVSNHPSIQGVWDPSMQMAGDFQFQAAPTTGAALKR